MPLSVQPQPQATYDPTNYAPPGYESQAPTGHKVMDTGGYNNMGYNAGPYQYQTQTIHTGVITPAATRVIKTNLVSLNKMF